MASSLGASVFTLTCEELRLFIEFSICRGEFGRIGSSPEAEISLPLVGFADTECTIHLDKNGNLWLIPYEKESSVILEPPSWFRAGPYKFLIAEKVDDPTPPPAKTELLLDETSPVRSRWSPAKLIAVGAGLCGLLAVAWLIGEYTGSPSSKATATSSQRAFVAEHNVSQDLPSTVSTDPEPLVDAPPNPESLATKLESSPPEPSPPEPSPPEPSPTPEALPQLSESMDLEKLARMVSPCVFLIETLDGSGTTTGSGSGFAVSSDGFVVTNFHVVEDGMSFVIFTQQGAKFENAEVVAAAPSSDLAVLKIDATGLPFLKLASANDAPVGKRVAVFGSPKGLGGTLSEGIISATPTDLQERFPGETFPNEGVLLQTTAPVSEGSSGSPLFDADGNVLGVITLKFNGRDQPQNLNFAVPVAALKPLISKALSKGQLFRRGSPEPAASTPNFRMPDKGIQSQQTAPLRDPAYAELQAKFRSQDWVNAMKIASVLVRKYPKSAIAHFQHAYCAAALRLDRQAEISFRKALEIRPDYHSAWHNLGIAIMNQNEPGRALAAFERAVALNPEAAESWVQIVIANVLLQSWAKATVSLNALDRVNPAAAKDLSRHISQFRVGDDDFKRAIAKCLAKKFVHTSRDGPVRVRVVGVASNDSLSIRSGPGTRFPVVATVPNGAEFFVVGGSEMNGTTEWVPIESGNWAGWVAGRFVKPTK